MRKSSLKSGFIFGSLLIISLNIIIYCNTFFSPFVFDDLYTLVETEGKVNFRNKLENIYDYSSIININRLRPITYYSLAVNYHLGKLNTYGYHLFNTLFHVFTALLVFFVIYYCFWFKNPAGKHSLTAPLLSSTFFSLLPIHTETVTYVISRATGLSAFFFLLALFFFARACLVCVEKITIKAVIFFLFTLLFFPASVFCKEVGLIFPAVIIIFDLLFLKQKGTFPFKFRCAFFYLPLVCFVVILGIKYSHFYSARAIEILKVRDISSNLFIQCNIAPLIFKNLFFPLNLNLDYDFSTIPSYFNHRTILSFSLLCLLFYVVWNLGSKVILFSFSWVVITLLPTNSVLPRLTPMSDHNLYLPSMGVCMGLAYLVYRLNRDYGRRSHKCIWVAMLGIAFFFACLAISRNNIYRSAEILWKDSIKKSPHFFRPYINLGSALMETGKFDEAILYNLKALQIEPGLQTAYNNLGVAFTKKGRLDEAVYYLRKLTEADPGFYKAFKNLGLVYKEKGMLRKAEQSFRRAIEVEPNYAEAYNDLGNVLEAQGKTAEAMAHYSRAVKIKPGLARAYYNMGTAFAGQKKFDKALSNLAKAIRINPGYAEAYNNLGIIYLKKGTPLKALPNFRMALTLKPDYENAHNNIGTLFFREGKLDQAKFHFKKAVIINPGSLEAHFNLGSVFLQEKEYDLAGPHFFKATLIDPNYAEAHFNLGIIWAEKGAPEKSDTYFSNAGRLKPELKKIINEIRKKNE